MFKKIFLLLVVFLTSIFFAAKQPQMLVLPLMLFIYLLRGFIRRVSNSVNLAFLYVLTGWLLGICVEVFAVWQNMKLPLGERKLFNQDPGLDLVIAAGFYLIVSVTLYLFVRRYKFSKKSFITVTAFYAIVVEQLGAVFIAGLANPLLWVYVAIIYGVWTVTPYLLFYDRFPERRSLPIKVYPVLLLALWAASFIGSMVGTLLSKMI